MSRQGSDPPNEPLPHQRALSRWDNEGGAGPCGPQMADPTSAEDQFLRRGEFHHRRGAVDGGALVRVG
jgi:hypothetical protein